MASQRRRRLFGWPLAMLLPTGAALRAQPRPPTDALRVGADPALFDSGLATQMQQAFERDTGIAVHLVRSPVLPLLDALERGELDAAFANAPAAEERLVSQGLAHDRRELGSGEFVLVGPPPQRKLRDPAGIAGGHDAAAALAAIRAAALAAPGSIAFLSAADGSGTHAAEQALWRRAGIAPEPPWYAAAGAAGGLIALARERKAYALVEHGAWLQQGGAAAAVLIRGDPQLVEPVHVLRAFRVVHPAGKLFVAWVAGPRGRRIVAERRGYRAAGA